MERFVADLAQQQVHDGHDVSVICLHPRPGLESQTSCLNNVTVHHSKIQAHFGFVPLSPAFAPNLRRIVRRTRPDVLHLHLPNPMVFSQRMLPDDVPLVVHWHADVRGAQGLILGLGYPVYALFEKAVLRRAAKIIATSPPYLAFSPTLRPFRSKCHVVPLGMDPQRIQTDRPNGSPGSTILAVGRLARYKGFEHLIRAARSLPQAKVEIIGNGPCRPRLEREIQRNKLENRVRLCGYLPDAKLLNRMAQADIFCLPSIHRSEAFGVVLLEAMFLQKPLVSTSIPGSGTGWVNENGKTGYVVPPGDPDALAKALDRLLDDPAARTAMGIAARTRFDEHFHIKRCAQAVETVYDAAYRS
ncbi:glycosyltransferase [Paucidesulfovibrio gracilis]|nr:glycosyltransferase [Paucidesulfovibrio gracilis]